MTEERKRASLFGNSEEETGTKLGLERFTPKKPAEIEPETVKELSEKTGFTQKHAKPKKKRDGRRLKKSARTSQFNVRLQPETAERFWQGAENQNMTYADDFLRHLLDLYEGRGS